jgi:hypothetical protein
MNRADAYVQVPHLLSSDPRFADVYNDRATLGAWLQMYLVADECYPNPAPLPRVEQTTLDTIEAAGLIEIRPGDRYTVLGLAEHREKTSSHARVAAWARWGNPPSNAPSNAPGITSVSSSSKNVEDENEDEGSITPSNAPSIDDDDLAAEAYAGSVCRRCGGPETYGNPLRRDGTGPVHRFAPCPPRHISTGATA